MKHYYELIKDNLSMIILLPTIMGGLWQILELSNMSISFIRFFSATQLLPDGLLILFIILPLYIAYKISPKYKFNLHKKIIKVTDKKPKNMKDYFIKKRTNNKLGYIDNPIYRKSMIWFDIFVVVFIPIFVFFTFYFDSLSSDRDEKIILVNYCSIVQFCFQFLNSFL